MQRTYAHQTRSYHGVHSGYNPRHFRETCLVGFVQVFIGEQSDVTRKGTSKLEFGKNYRSGPISSWTGGMKASEGIGKRASSMCTGILSDLLQAEVRALHCQILLQISMSCWTS